jgi:hypothetical protein
MDGNVMYGQSDMDYVLEHFPIFRSRTDLVAVRLEDVVYLRDLEEPVTLKVFMGTWNEDAQIHVPALFKAVREARNDRITVRVIAMDRLGNDRDGLVEKYDIAHSPTITIEHRGMEIGRYVVLDAPMENSLASGVVSILRDSLGR